MSKKELTKKDIAELEETLVKADIVTIQNLLKLAQSFEEEELKADIDTLRESIAERLRQFLCTNVVVIYTETKKYGIDENAKLSDIQADFDSEIDTLDSYLNRYEYKRKTFEEYCKLMMAVLPDFIKELEEELEEELAEITLPTFSTVCNVCGRKSTQKKGTKCGMIQPSGQKCTGIFDDL